MQQFLQICDLWFVIIVSVPLLLTLFLQCVKMLEWYILLQVKNSSKSLHKLDKYLRESELKSI